MSNEKIREEFESSPRFRGMDFTRSASHHEYYESPYANGAWDGWQASRESLVVELPEKWGEYTEAGSAACDAIDSCREAIHAAGVRTK